MKASNVKVRELQYTSDCYKAIDSIWMDSRNVIGGADAFYSGRTTYLTETAKNKIAAIERRLERLIEKLPEDC